MAMSLLSSFSPSVVVPPPAEVLSVMPVHTIHDLITVMQSIEQDPLDMESYLLSLCGDLEEPKSVTLKEVMDLKDTRKMKNAMEGKGIGLKTVVYFLAWTQSGKTWAMMYNFWAEGQKQLLEGSTFAGFQYTMNLCGEGKRMKEEADKFNRILSICAKMLGIDEYSKIDFYHSEKNGDDTMFLKSLKEVNKGNLKAIPVYSLLANASKVSFSASKLISKMSRYVGRDEPTYLGEDGKPRNDGMMTALLVQDEAELFIQPGTTKKVDGEKIHKLGALSEAMNTGVTLKFPHNHFGMEVKLQSHKNTVYECFSSHMKFTATPQALAFGTTTGGRAPKTVRAEPSSRYWTYDQTPGVNCKKIKYETIVRDALRPGWVGMLQDMMPSQFTRHCLVTGHLKKTQCNIAMDASKRFPALISCAWSGDGIVIFTQDDGWVTTLMETGSFNLLDVGGGVKRLTSISSLEIDNEWDPVEESLNWGNICSYRGFMQFISEQNDHCIIPKTMCVAKKMIERGTPVKAWGHGLPLSDMYVDFDLHEESLIQVLGRLSGIDLRTQTEGKTLWAPKKTIDFHKNAIRDAMNVFGRCLETGETIKEILEKLREQLYTTCDDTLQDTSGVSQIRLKMRCRKMQCTESAEVTKKKLTSEATVRGKTIIDATVLGKRTRNTEPEINNKKLKIPESAGSGSGCELMPERRTEVMSRLKGSYKVGKFVKECVEFGEGNVFSLSEIDELAKKYYKKFVLSHFTGFGPKFACRYGPTLYEVGEDKYILHSDFFKGGQTTGGSKGTVQERLLEAIKHIGKNGEHVTLSDIRIFDSKLSNDLKTGKYKAHHELIRLGSIEKVADGVFKLPGI